MFSIVLFLPYDLFLSSTNEFNAISSKFLSLGTELKVFLVLPFPERLFLTERVCRRQTEI